jgi:DNA topoisomerase-1
MCSLGEGDKPKRSRHPRAATDKADVDLEMAVKLLSLPREVGLHPEDGKKITANFGRFGLMWPITDSMLRWTRPKMCSKSVLNRAVTLLAEKKAKGPGRRGAQTSRIWAPPRRQADQGAEGQVRSLCQRRRDQCHPAGRHRARSRDHGTGAGLIAERAAKGGKRRKPPPKQRPKAEEAREKPPKKPMARRKKPPPNQNHKQEESCQAAQGARKAARQASKAKVPEMAGE